MAPPDWKRYWTKQNNTKQTRDKWTNTQHNVKSHSATKNRHVEIFPRRAHVFCRHIKQCRFSRKDSLLICSKKKLPIEKFACAIGTILFWANVQSICPLGWVLVRKGKSAAALLVLQSNWSKKGMISYHVFIARSFSTPRGQL